MPSRARRRVRLTRLGVAFIAFAVLSAATLLGWIARAVQAELFPPLDEKGPFGLISNRAANRWLRENRLIGKTVSEIQAAFGAQNVYVDSDLGAIDIGYDSAVLGSIHCELQDGRVTRARLEVP